MVSKLQFLLGGNGYFLLWKKRMLAHQNVLWLKEGLVDDHGVMIQEGQESKADKKAKKRILNPIDVNEYIFYCYASGCLMMIQ
ncbi:unnamed protein product [Arabis nemorensis]|uniref:Uncharacterized protein n=1 Tax=Arabis nemorensis TaxID=586526 RepID=A0A565B9Q4_9BRAS|nr:unnamed protein product [Arabis nemorensis]